MLNGGASEGHSRSLEMRAEWRGVALPRRERFR